MVLPQYLYWFPLSFSLVALALAFVGTSCHFIQFTSVDASNPLKLEFGYWYYRSWTIADNSTDPFVEGCKLYPSSVPTDETWDAARGLNLTTIILGGALVMLDMFQGCVSARRNKSLQTGAAGYLVCCITSGLSLLLLNSDLCRNNPLVGGLNRLEGVQFHETCSISQGAKSTIAATVLWFAAAVGTAALHPFHERERMRDSVEGLDEPLFVEENTTL